MTIDRSLKGKGRLARARGVLSRDERIAKMREEDRWMDGRSPFGLPKIRVAKAAAGKKKKVKDAAEGDAAAAPAADAKGGAKAAAKPAAKAAAKPAAKSAGGKK